MSRKDKDDDGKADVALLIEGFPRALLSVAAVATFGAKKYSRHGWLLVDDAAHRYKSAGMRHALEHCGGKEFDHESMLPSLAHAAWNALAELELYLRSAESVRVSGVPYRVRVPTPLPCQDSESGE